MTFVGKLLTQEINLPAKQMRSKDAIEATFIMIITDNLLMTHVSSVVSYIRCV
jgi:hypothetical protein